LFVIVRLTRKMRLLHIWMISWSFSIVAVNKIGKICPQQKLKNEFKSNLLIFFSDFVTKPDLIQAKVPILKFCDLKQGLEVDLNCNNSVGIRNTHLLYCYAHSMISFFSLSISLPFVFYFFF
jgi:hypothetical protein